MARAGTSKPSSKRREVSQERRLMHIRRVYRTGQSLTITIPSGFAALLGLKVQDHVVFFVEGQEMVLRKVDLAQLAELLGETREAAVKR